MSALLIVGVTEKSAYTTRGAITIEGDSGFTGANGVTGGTGTQGDPFIISGWDIDASSAHGIAVRNTSAHFVVQDSYVHSAAYPFYMDGVHFLNVTNGKVANCTISGNLIAGIHAESSDNTSMEDNFLSALYGVRLWTSENMTVSNNTLTGGSTAVSINDLSHGTIVDNNISGTGGGISVQVGDNIEVRNNSLEDIGGYGIGVWSCTWSTIVSNNLTNDTHVGIAVYGGCSNVTVDSNQLYDCKYGIGTQNARDLSMIDNNVSSSSDRGINIDRTVNVTAYRNVVWGCGFSVVGLALADFNTHAIPTNNSVNGSPVYYYKDSSGVSIDGISAGQVILANCDNSTVNGLHMTDNDLGLIFAYSETLTVTGNVVLNTNHCCLYLRNVDDSVFRGNNFSGAAWTGLSVVNCDNISILNNAIYSHGIRGLEISRMTHTNITGNTISNNTYEGIYYDGQWQYCWTNITYNNISNNARGIFLIDCSLVFVHHNNFINNTIQALDNQGSLNTWDDGYPSGGNYWDNYTYLDQLYGPHQTLPGADNIWDAPFIIDQDSLDYYPFVTPVPEFPSIILPAISMVLMFLTIGARRKARPERRS